MQRIERCVATDGAEIAYAVSGEGPPLVLPAWWVSDLERDWHWPNWQQFFERLGQTHTVIRYDRPGVGQSGGQRTSFTQDDEALYLETVVRHVDRGPVAMLAMSCGGPPAITLAVREPDLVKAVVLYASYSNGQALGRADSREALVAFVRSTWGSVGARTLSDLFNPGASKSELKELAQYQRDVATPEVAAELLQLTYDMNVVETAPRLECPVLILHRSDDQAIPSRCGRDLAALIPDAEYIEFGGSGHAIYDDGSDLFAREIERFLLGHSPTDVVDRVLTTVLFTDIVDSTPLVTQLGDEAWRERLNQHDRVIAATVDDYGGRLVKSTGDGVLALFDLPSQAVKCAQALHQEVAALGLPIRAGLHTGEVELRGDDVSGLAVHVAARVQAQADAGMTLTTATVRDLSAGGGLQFREHTNTELKGIDGPWALYSCS